MKHEINPITKDDLLPFLSQDVMDCGISEQIHVFDTLGSTNTKALSMARDGAKHGTIIIAESQTSGKGRYGRAFFSPRGHGIYISFILRRDVSNLAENMTTMVTAYAAVAVCRTLELIGFAPKIKWVNDILLGEKKVCGILTESLISDDPPTIDALILGIGINFTTPETGFPDEIGHSACSLFGSDIPPVTRAALAAMLINQVLHKQAQSPHIPQDSFLPDSATQKNHSFFHFDVLQEYRKRLVMKGKKIVVHGVGLFSPYEATVVDVDHIGRLVVRRDNGETEVLSSGEISLSISLGMKSP